MSQFFPSGGQSIGVSASSSVLPMNSQDWFPLGLTALISLQSKRLSSLLQQHSSKASILRHSALFMVQLLHPYMTTGKTIALTRQTFITFALNNPLYDSVASNSYHLILLTVLWVLLGESAGLVQLSSSLSGFLMHLWLASGETIARWFSMTSATYLGFPGGSCGKEPACQFRKQKRCWFNSWVGKVPWRRAWQSTPVFLPGESLGQRSLADYSPWGHEESDTTEAT